MEDIRIEYTRVYLYIIIFNTVLGVLFGLFPLLVGFRLNNRKYAFYGFALSILAGALTGVLLAFPIALLFVWLIVRTPQTESVPAVESSPAPSTPSVDI